MTRSSDRLSFEGWGVGESPPRTLNNLLTEISYIPQTASDQIQLPGARKGLRAAMGVELAVGVVDVGLYGAHADEELEEIWRFACRRL